MDLTLLLKSLIMGIVEGMTEFLPVSSLGHVIIFGYLLHFPTEIAATFDVFVQVGALIALVLHFERDLIAVLQRVRTEQGARQLLLAIAIAFLPVAVVGVLLGDMIKQYLFSPLNVAIALIVGGILMLIVEQIIQRRKPSITRLEGVSPLRALAIGISQVLALYPGMSRSGPTIAGGLLVSLDRPTALKFSFYLAIPTLLAASAFDFIRSINNLAVNTLPVFIIGAIASFLVALVVIRFFLVYVSNHTLRPFAWYRIAFGVAMIILYVPIH
jgi:undecaprenyl-diphosphatase